MNFAGTYLSGRQNYDSRNLKELLKEKIHKEKRIDGHTLHSEFISCGCNYHAVVENLQSLVDEGLVSYDNTSGYYSAVE